MSKLSQRTATELCSIGMSQMGRFRADAMEHINASIAADSNYCLPLIVKASMLHGANDARFDDAIAKLIEQSQPLLPSGKSNEADLLEAVTVASAGRGVEAATIYEQLLNDAPDDLFLHVLAQEQIFWLGQPQWMRDIAERAAPAWAETHQDYGPLLSLRAFANEEAGYFKEAEYFGRAAVEIDPSDVWGAHAVAHVLVMKGEMRNGIAWLEGLSGNWGHANQMRHHLWWHFCLFLLELGEYDRIIELLDTEVRNLNSPLVKASPAATIDINNYSSLLMRLELYGVDVSIHWQKLAALCAERITNHGSAFSNIHDMMVLSASGNSRDANALLANMVQQFASPDQMSSVALSYKVVGIPVCEAILAHREKDYRQVLAKLGGVRHQLQMMGASHAQRDVFYHLLVHAAEAENRDDLRNVFLHDIERLGFCEVPKRAAYQSKEH
ncbi:MAG: tetratricopeptide repeat protein [Granulosicoccaceae bacterium]